MVSGVFQNFKFKDLTFNNLQGQVGQMRTIGVGDT